MTIFHRGLLFLLSSSPLGVAMLVHPIDDRPSHDRPKAGRSASATLIFLSQGWSAETRATYHYAPQGSELVPYYWFLNLMEPGGTKPLKDDLKQFGLLYDDPTPIVRKRNPDGLPIGFARQGERRTLGGITEKHWLGLTCAACHTGAIVPKAGSNARRQGTILIDGAPAKIDFGAFLTKLQASVQATNDDPVRLRTLAEKAYAAKDGGSVEEIEARFHNYTRQLNDILALYLPQNGGPGRVDCFGAIINRVCVYDIQSPQSPPAKLDAPVDFPFLWYSDRQSAIQWFGELANESWLDRLSRNAGEVSGVFAQVVVKPNAGVDGYPSSIDVPGLARIDRDVSALKPPRWADVFPAPNAAAVLRGRKLFKPTCQAGGCHQDVAPKYKVAKVGPTPLKQDPSKPHRLPDLDTDENNTKLIHGTFSGAGLLTGTPLFVIGGDPITSPFPATALVGNVVAGQLLGAKLDVIEAYLGLGARRQFEKGKNVAAITKRTLGTSYPTMGRTKPEDPPAPIGYDPLRNGYESRSLNGIWATAPYLHNGSVPSLVGLLWPKWRPTRFYAGSIVYDPKGAGFVSDGSAGGKLFDTTAPGNSNRGHTYGANLSDRQKYDLLAYLKTL